MKNKIYISKSVIPSDDLLNSIGFDELVELFSNEKEIHYFFKTILKKPVEEIILHIRTKNEKNTTE